jgi:hypothetical protein
MRVHISLTDDSGTEFEGDADLALAGAPGTSRRRAKAATTMKVAPKAASAKLDFTKSERAFVKTHAKGLSGARKFVLLLAYLTKGVANKEVPLNDVRKQWGRMTKRLGTFNSFFTNEAKENGWVDTKKKGIYILTPAWKEALTDSNG